MQSRDSTVKGFRLRGYGVTTYCKVTETMGSRINFSFGMGRNKWCMNIKYDGKKSEEAYIDRVEHNDLCVEGESLSTILQGTVKLVRLGIYFVKHMLPQVSLFTLMDDSHIYCNGGQNGPSISLAYETITKYNQTWYQQKCGAVLPGFVSAFYPTTEVEAAPSYMEDIPISISGKPMVMRVVRDSIMAHYLYSIRVLDEPCGPWSDYSEGSTKIDGLLPYRELYEASSSPRDFIARVRAMHSKDYCLSVHRWFNSYIRSLRLKDFKDSWVIPVEIIQTPPDFSMAAMGESAARAKLNGGGRGGARQTRKRRWSMGPRTVIGPGGMDFRTME
jgi:hypothetical protein